jgi:hypothetical protein
MAKSRFKTDRSNVMCQGKDGSKPKTEMKHLESPHYYQLPGPGESVQGTSIHLFPIRHALLIGYYYTLQFLSLAFSPLSRRSSFLSCCSGMQQPTCTNVRIRSTQDAHKIFFAIQQDLLRMVTRRLDAEERLALKTGCVYAWEERGPHTEVTGLGIERFTEGRRWSPSRVRDVCTFFLAKAH